MDHSLVISQVKSFFNSLTVRKINSSLTDVLYFLTEPPTGDYPFASGPGGPDGPGGPFVPGYTDFGPGSGPDSYSPESRPFFGYPGHLDGFNGPPPPNHGPPPPGQPLGPNSMSL